jgi:hypothetical protein
MLRADQYPWLGKFSLLIVLLLISNGATEVTGREKRTRICARLSADAN